MTRASTFSLARWYQNVLSNMRGPGCHIQCHGNLVSTRLRFPHRATTSPIPTIRADSPRLQSYTRMRVIKERSEENSYGTRHSRRRSPNSRKLNRTNQVEKREAQTHRHHQQVAAVTPLPPSTQQYHLNRTLDPLKQVRNRIRRTRTNPRTPPQAGPVMAPARSPGSTLDMHTFCLFRVVVVI